MTSSRWALASWWAVAMLSASLARAGVWGGQPVIGISGDYSTNPGLLNLPDTAEAHGALLLDAPTSYVGNATKFSILPSVRLSNARGYSSLDSDYEHLNFSEELDTERDVFIANGGLARDSSLTHDFLLNGSTGVERNSLLGDVNWDRHLTERLDLDNDLNYSRVRYAEGTGTVTLTDYRYASFAPSLAWNTSERGKLTTSASVGRYESLNGQTTSTSANLQVGFTKQVTEYWTLGGSGGYSRANNEANTEEPAIVYTPNGFEIVLIPIQVKSTQTGSVYAVTATRQAERLYLALTASRQLVPSGFAFLSRQEAYELKVAYPPSERWNLSADLHAISYAQPADNGATSTLRTDAVLLSASWQWTEHWTLSFGANYIFERTGAPSISIDSTGVSVELSRKFDWKTIR